eukprot:TRINITY_DN1991_c1_g1_i3.p1 TRINITY_DN1991_c1_g1~~TRINITY_DN1991_c1_g1_i3.p1  ORF type:complete len:438 (-),score=89.88 TRINITY_DN1991_c1_g1_i3:67-1380(-)
MKDLYKETLDVLQHHSDATLPSGIRCLRYDIYASPTILMRDAGLRDSYRWQEVRFTGEYGYMRATRKPDANHARFPSSRVNFLFRCDQARCFTALPSKAVYDWEVKLCLVQFSEVRKLVPKKTAPLVAGSALQPAPSFQPQHQQQQRRKRSRSFATQTRPVVAFSLSEMDAMLVDSDQGSSEEEYRSANAASPIAVATVVRNSLLFWRGFSSPVNEGCDTCSVSSSASERAKAMSARASAAASLTNLALAAAGTTTHPGLSMAFRALPFSPSNIAATFARDAEHTTTQRTAEDETTTRGTSPRRAFKRAATSTSDALRQYWDMEGGAAFLPAIIRRPSVQPTRTESPSVCTTSSAQVMAMAAVSPLAQVTVRPVQPAAGAADEEDENRLVIDDDSEPEFDCTSSPESARKSRAVAYQQHRGKLAVGGCDKRRRVLQI